MHTNPECNYGNIVMHVWRKVFSTSDDNVFKTSLTTKIRISNREKVRNCRLVHFSLFSHGANKYIKISSSIEIVFFWMERVH